ncbi:MAG: helix-turn-helix transcriptional regulator [Ruminococcaceae bacterium]|nr:helix-turn-helix transcriptional regulator [Oscillospiraceae bacterium]
MNIQSKNLHSVLSVDRLYTAFILDFDSNFYFTGESHDFWEIDCILTGSIGFTSGTKLYECSDYELVIHQPDVFHTSWALKENITKILTITFNAEGDEYFVPKGKFILNSHERKIIDLLVSEISSTFNNQLTIYSQCDKESEQIIKCLMETLLLSLNRRSDQAEVAKSRNASRFSDIAKYMKDHVCQPLVLDEICKECHIGKTALKELFKHYTGTSVIKYYNYLRIRHAIKLMYSGMSMEEISCEMNFSSQNYFSTFFKRETGYSPINYKNHKIK